MNQIFKLLDIVLRSFVFLMIYSGVFVDTAKAKDGNMPTFKTSPPKFDKVVVEDTYFFVKKEYIPSINVGLLKRIEASYETPESTVFAQINAMRSKDFKWFMSTWDKSSQKIMRERDKALKQTENFWITNWDKVFKNRRVELTQRIETGKYVIIVYKLLGEKIEKDLKNNTNDNGIDLETTLKQENGRWLATQELSQDPVLLYWKTPEYRLKREIRGIMNPDKP